MRGVVESSNGAAKLALARDVGLIEQQREPVLEPKVREIDHRKVLVEALRAMGPDRVAELLREAGYEFEGHDAAA